MPDVREGAAREVVERLRHNSRLGPTLVHAEVVPGTPARWAPLPDFLHPDTRGLLTARGRERLYSHQAQAVILAHAGRDVLVTTPTASGKSLCYQVPVIDRLVRDPQAVAIYMAPTKALARDQYAELVRQAELLPAGSALRPDQIVALDGDVPWRDRAALRERARIVVTNPDFLHFSVLYNHQREWSHFLPFLSHVVVDEIHSFRGLFGGHVGNVFRRLNRLHGDLTQGDRPPLQYIGASATVANERELARRLLDRDVSVVGSSGAPTAARHVLFLDPSAVQQDSFGGRSASSNRVGRVYEQLIRETGMQQMLFCRSRRGVEWTVDALRTHAGTRGMSQDDAETRIRAYRGGFTAPERRAIEAGLRNGTIRTVVSSNALEMGIDVGSVGCVMSLGYPGTVASTWQQWGRAGRTGDAGPESLAVFLATADPLDQYIVRNPGFLLDREAEHAHLHPEHPALLQRHLPCVLSEAGSLRIADPGPDGTPRARAVWDALQTLVAEGKVDEPFVGEGLYSYSGPRNALRFSLRDIGGSTRIMLDSPRGNPDREPLGTIEARQSEAMVHPGAVYVHDGSRYRVRRLDREQGVAYVVPEPDGRQLTEPVRSGNVRVLDTYATDRRGQAEVNHGRVRVHSRVEGYRIYEERSRGRLEVLPEVVPLEGTQPVVYDTSSYWLSIPDRVRRALTAEGLWSEESSGLALGQLLYRLAPLHLMCDPGDLDLHVRDGGPNDPYPVTIFIHETYEEGLGLGATLHARHDALLKQAVAAVRNCPCVDGCPACVGPSPDAADRGEDADRKHLVAALLVALARD